MTEFDDDALLDAVACAWYGTKPEDGLDGTDLPTEAKQCVIEARRVLDAHHARERERLRALLAEAVESVDADADFAEATGNVVGMKGLRDLAVAIRAALAASDATTTQTEEGT